MTGMSRSASSSNYSRGVPTWIIGAIGLVLVAIVLFFANSSSSQAGRSPASESPLSSTKTSLINFVPKSGVDGAKSFYHCSGKSTDDGDIVDLILLHGAAFTKENWKSSGIFKNLCSFTRLNVIALDLENGASHEDLRKSIDDMRAQQILATGDPVALVTPSMSGGTIVSWLNSSRTDSKVLLSYVDRWIPVAAGAVSSASDESLLSLKDKLKILALYGSRDQGGKVTSQRLQQASNAKMVEIQGGHPCYLDSPDDFIRHVLAFLGVS